MEVKVKNERDLKENEWFKESLVMINAIQPDQQKLTHGEMDVLIILMKTNTKTSPFKGRQRERLLDALGITSSHLAIITKSLVSKGHLIKSGKRGVYILQKSLEKIKDLYNQNKITSIHYNVRLNLSK